MQEEKSYLESPLAIRRTDGMDSVRKLIAEKLMEQGKTMAEVSRAIGRNHAYLQQFLKRNVPQDFPEKHRPALARELGVPESSLKRSLNGTQGLAGGSIKPLIADHGQTLSYVNKPGSRPGSELVGEVDLPVFGMAEGGRGALIITDEPVDRVVRPEPLLRVKEGYGIIVSGDSMSPAHKSGSTALVNPHLPPRPGDSCIFRSHAEDGTVHICIKELVRATKEEWIVKQYTPAKTFGLKRSLWQECHVVVGNFAR